ncbi:MAG: DUF3298 domain-containing protein [Prevotella sp.]|nr:DUF3298 domain-containing protein [Prevotella sp.]
MRNVSHIIIGTLLLVCSGCQQKSQLPMPAIIETDSIHAGQEDRYGRYEITAEMPRQDVIAEWIGEQLGGTYEGSLADGQQLLASSLKEIRNGYVKEIDEWMGETGQDTANYYYECHFKKHWETARFVTYEHMVDVYTGGVHGSYIISGQTFRKSDGRRMGWEILRDSYDDSLQQLVKDGLKEYFQVDSDEDLCEECINLEAYMPVPLPVTPPLFTDEGVLFLYQQYEIAPYAAGLPCFTIPYEKLKPHLIAAARQLTE